jgi:hypothetical protein
MRSEISTGAGAEGGKSLHALVPKDRQLVAPPVRAGNYLLDGSEAGKAGTVVAHLQRLGNLPWRLSALTCGLLTTGPSDLSVQIEAVPACAWRRGAAELTWSELGGKSLEEFIQMPNPKNPSLCSWQIGNLLYHWKEIENGFTFRRHCTRFYSGDD